MVESEAVEAQIRRADYKVTQGVSTVQESTELYVPASLAARGGYVIQFWPVT